MRFIYHPDNTIYVNNIIYSFDVFISQYPNFPLIEGEFFSYIDGTYHDINSEGHNIPETPEKNLIDAIGKL